MHSWAGMRNHWLFHLVHSGRGSFCIGGKTFPLIEGEGFLAPPNTKIHYWADSAQPWAYSWLGCAGTAAEFCFAACGLSAEHPIYRSEDLAFYRVGGEFMALMGRLKEYSDSFSRSAGLYEAFARLREAACERTALPTATPPRNLAEAYGEAVQLFIQANYSCASTRIEDMAEKVGVSRKYLSEVIHRKFGKSPRALLSEYRLDRACALLTDTNLNVSAIAASVGFGDQSAFSRAFHQAYGISPSEWRSKGSS